MSSLTWRDVVVKLLGNEAHIPLQRRVQYCGERIKWFFMMQKEVVIEFMAGLESNPTSYMYSGLYTKHAKLINQNDMIKHLVFKTFDDRCERQLRNFMELFENLLTSTFANPWVFLKSATVAPMDDDDMTDSVLPSVDDTKERIPKELQNRASFEVKLTKWIHDIPVEADQIDEAVDKVQMLVLKFYGLIRGQVCDQVELFAESFFKLPMLRRLEEDMANLTLSDADKANYARRRERLGLEIKAKQDNLVEINGCIERLQSFKLKCDSKNM